MSVLNENTIIGASAAGGDYEIEQSLRFNKSDTASLMRTPSVASNQRTWTWSGWVKKCGDNLHNHGVFDARQTSSGQFTQLNFNTLDKLQFYTSMSGVDYSWESLALFRDPSAWYHIVAVLNTPSSTQQDRFIVYINGVRQANGNQYGALDLNVLGWINSTNPHSIGEVTDGGHHLHGYMGEVNFIDGLALTPDSFGETGDYGEWKPIAYDGTYGTNGFYLPFKQDYAVEGFSTVTYEGNGSGQYIGGVGFQPDLTWFKCRSDSSSSAINDSIRGRIPILTSNTTAAEVGGIASDDDLISWETDGFLLGHNDSANSHGRNNVNARTYVAWNWDMGGTTASNTSGSITSSVRANTTYGQSIISWTGDGGTGTVGHGLTSAPEFWITKDRASADNWLTFFTIVDGSLDAANLNLTNAAGTGSVSLPTSSVFTNDGYTSSQNLITYAFHSVTGYSKFGSYSGSGSAGKAITTGFAPAFVMTKRTDAVSNWIIWDNTRNPFNPADKHLLANANSAEATATNPAIDFTSTGFELAGNDSSFNASGGTYIYAAFADTREYAFWYDQSGNNNDWTSEGGLTESDVMVDSPTNNFATLNPLNRVYTGSTFSEGNLKITGTAINNVGSHSSMNVPLTGKWYAEFLTLAFGGGTPLFGINHGVNSLGGEGVTYRTDGAKEMIGANGNTYTPGYGATWTIGDVMAIGYDADSNGGQVTFYKNGVSQGVAFTGTNANITEITGELFFGCQNNHASTSTFIWNFGQDSSFAGNKTPQGNQDSNGIGDFYYAPPSGFLALCTSNLPDADVIPSENFNAVLYTGNQAANVAVTGVGFQPDLVWGKNRSSASNHWLFDSVRGINKMLQADQNNAEETQSGVRAFNSFSVTLGTWIGSTKTNDSYVAWNWKAGGAASSNTNGSITSSVSANPAAGFSIVSWTHGSGSQSIGHGLSQKPDMIIVKGRSNISSWWTWHKGLSSETQSFIHVNTTSAAGANVNAWNNQAPTASVFYQKEYILSNNDTGIAYCFHSVEGHSKVGSFIGNGDENGPFVHCGFKPAFLLFRRSTETGSWFMFDNARGTTYNVSGTNFDNVRDNKLNAEANDAEDADSSWNIDFLSNGFKLRSPHVYMNGNNLTHIFIAFAESPFKHTNAH